MIIYLYIKQHSITGLKYFGKTVQNPFTYDGSGTYWQRHIKKHGKQYIKTLDIFGFDHQEDATEFALKFSSVNDIVESKEWANLKEENAQTGGAYYPTSEQIANIKYRKGENHPYYGKKRPEHSSKMKIIMKGKEFTKEHKVNIGKASKGRGKNIPKSESHRENIGKALIGFIREKIECEYCHEMKCKDSYHIHLKTCRKNPANNYKQSYCVICGNEIKENGLICSFACRTEYHRKNSIQCEYCLEFIGANNFKKHHDTCRKNPEKLINKCKQCNIPISGNKFCSKSCSQKYQRANEIKIKCNHCGVAVSPGNFKRWHGDNCKHKH